MHVNRNSADRSRDTPETHTGDQTTRHDWTMGTYTKVNSVAELLISPAGHSILNQ